MTQSMLKTLFKQNGSDLTDCLIEGLYTPVESLTQVLLYGKRIEHLAWKDEITAGGVTRTIYFDWYKEPEVKTDLFNQK